MALKRLRLIQRRKALGFTQEDLAGYLGCERTTIIRWERAETEPQPWLRPRIAQLLRLTNQAEADCLAANTYIELALRATQPSRWQYYATKAAVHSLRAGQSRGEGYVRSRVFDEIRLAKVRLGQREAAESAAVGMHALHLAADTRSTLVVNWLLRFDRALTDRYPDVADVTEFHEQLREYLRKAAPMRAGEL